MHAHMNECMHVYIHASACTMYSARDMLKCGLSMSVYAAPLTKAQVGFADKLIYLFGMTSSYVLHDISRLTHTVSSAVQCMLYIYICDITLRK